MLEVSALSVSYGGIGAVHDVSLMVGPGEIATVIGPNGAGKTTLLNAIMGVHGGTGSVRFKGQDLGPLNVEQRVRHGISLVPEKRELFATLSVEDNLRLGGFRLRHEGRQASAGALGDVFALFPRLAERRRQRAGTLSGGERQMLAMGRALMARPEVLMLDEPSLGLAPLIVREIFRIIAGLRSRGCAILLVEQNARAALQRLRPWLCAGDRQGGAAGAERGAGERRPGGSHLPRFRHILIALVNWKAGRVALWSKDCAVAISKSESTSLDLLRFTAALTVFLHHANWLRLDWGALAWFRRDVGHSAVVIFFVLSGYVIAATLRPSTTPIDYFIKRASRIYSVAVPAVLLTMAIDLACQRWGIATPAPAYQLHHPLRYAGLGLVFGGDLWTLAEPLFSNQPYWSLDYEVWYYVAFGVFAFARGAWRWAGLLLVLGIMGPKLWFLFPIWIGGVLVLRAQQRWSLEQGPARAIAVAAILAILALKAFHIEDPINEAGAALAAAVLPISLRFSQWYLGDMLLGVIAMALVFAIRDVNLSYPRRLQRFISGGARLSFGLYLMHFPLLAFFGALVPGPAAIVLALLGALSFAAMFEPQKDRLRRLLTGSVALLHV